MGGDAIYVGAKGRISHSELDKLGRNWVVQPKMDGVYVRIETDCRGLVAGMFSRSGRKVSHLLGPYLGVPNATLVGELEAQTERSQAAVESRGYQRCWLFDALALAGEKLDGRPYRERRDALQKAMARGEAGMRFDRRGRCHDEAGRFAGRHWHSWRVVRQLHASRWVEMWASHVEGSGGEGIVAVSLGARAGARNAKRKAKLVDHESMTVVRVDETTCELNRWGHRRGIVVAKGKHRPQPGDLVDVAVEGWYRSGLPRFARIVRVRHDLG